MGFHPSIFPQASAGRTGGGFRARKAGEAPPLARAVVPADTLNRTERRYADLLELRKRAGEIIDYSVQAVTLKIGTDCRYTADFFVQEIDGTLTFIEVKGFMRDDALVKFRAAQAAFPMFRFRMERWNKGQWETIRE